MKLTLPFCRQSADGQTIANMTNLALKGIIGVKAMAEIARAVGETLDATQYDVSRVSASMWCGGTPD